EAIGAPRAAAKVRTAQDTSIGGMVMQHGLDPQGLQEMMKGLDLAKMIEQFRGTVARAMPELAARAGLPVPERKPVPPSPDIESWEQVENQLENYVRAHQRDLETDIEKYGDPRTQPGFDPQKRRQELEGMRRRELDLDAQREAVAKIEKVM